MCRLCSCERSPQLTWQGDASPLSPASDASDVYLPAKASAVRARPQAGRRARTARSRRTESDSDSDSDDDYDACDDDLASDAEYSPPRVPVAPRASPYFDCGVHAAQHSPSFDCSMPAAAACPDELAASQAPTVSLPPASASEAPLDCLDNGSCVVMAPVVDITDAVARVDGAAA